MMDILGEVLIELYMELMLLIVPEKNITKKQRRIAQVIAAVEILFLAALAIWGAVLVDDYRNPWGWGIIATVAALSLAQVIAGVVLYKKHHES